MGKLFNELLGLCLKPKQAKFLQSTSRDTFSKLGLNREDGKNVRLSTENWPYYLGNGRK